jgi:hypothetical protein
VLVAKLLCLALGLTVCCDDTPVVLCCAVQAMSRHKLAPTATAALGRTLLGAALLGAFRKEEEKIQVGVTVRVGC